MRCRALWGKPEREGVRESSQPDRQAGRHATCMYARKDVHRLRQLDAVLSLVIVLGTQKPVYIIGKGEHAI